MPTFPPSQGAVAFVDISGFTKLSETLKQQHGKGGSEKLNVYINAYFEQLIREVSKFHGDVIKFAGDALQARTHAARSRSQPPAAAAQPFRKACFFAFGLVRHTVCACTAADACPRASRNEPRERRHPQHSSLVC